MSVSQRNKGKRCECEVAALLRPLFPEVRTKRAGGESASQDRGRDLLGTTGLCVQIKGHARPFPLRALYEAQHAALEEEIPVAICKEVRRGARSEWSATIPLTCFLALLALARGFAPVVQGDVVPIATPNTSPA